MAGLPDKAPPCAVEVILLLLPNKLLVDKVELVLLLFPNKLPFGTVDPVELLLNNPVGPVGFGVKLLFPDELPILLEVVLLVPPNRPPDGCVGLLPNNELLVGCWPKVLALELALNKLPDGLGVEVFALALALPNNPVDF